MDVCLYCEETDSVRMFGKADDIIKIPSGRDGWENIEIRDFFGGNAIAVFLPETADLSGTAVCLGDFDGVHAGHRRLFELAKEKNKRWGVLLLNGHNEDGMLTTMSERIGIIEEAGADYVVIAEFTENFARKTPSEFSRLISDVIKADTVVAGYDYRFGYKAGGDTNDLQKLLADKAEVVVADAVTDGGSPVKSTKIRNLVRNGDMCEANRLLSRDFCVRGKIVRGKQNGHKLGFPTANFEVGEDKILPTDGVYAGKVNGMAAVINIGKNPTFGAEKRTFEAHITGFDGDLYGKTLTAEILYKIRDEIRFDGTDELKRQIERDIDAVREKRRELWQKEQ